MGEFIEEFHGLACEKNREAEAADDMISLISASCEGKEGEANAN